MKRTIPALALALLGVTVAIAFGAPRRDGAIIRNTGSTNFSGYTIKIWSDGATQTLHSNRAGQPLDQPVNGRVPKAVADQLFRDLRSAKGQPTGAQACMKSASFGTTTVVEYHGWTTPDLECGGNGFVIALGSDVHKVAALLHVQGIQPHRIPMLPNEPRRPEPTGGQASASPEPAPSAS